MSLKAIFLGYPGGISPTTADDGNGPVALTTTSVASISIDTPLRVFSISELSSAAEVLTKASTLVVHSLDVHDIEVAKLGGAS
ncbi:flavin reductase family protein [Glutamicibacter ectropisis]|uniref:Flavin reductase family protein n=1 Tax=Glutamicibacter ectropisis TaxID=3046593 RepID=A0AAU6WF01_9MICC